MCNNLTFSQVKIQVLMTLGVSYIDGGLENHYVPIVPNKIPGTPSINGYVSIGLLKSYGRQRCIQGPS